MTGPVFNHPLIQTDARLRAAYAEGAGIYRIVPAGVSLPASLVDLREVIAAASKAQIGLIPRGAGSGIPGNAVGSGIVLDLRERMPRRLEVDAESRTAITSSNITQAELTRAALTYGLRLPPDPSSSGWATLGGMVSTNASGPRTVRYGSVRPWVEAIELVTADGEVGWLERGGRGGQSGQGWRLEAIKRFSREAVCVLHDARELIQSRFPKTRKNTAGYALDRWLTSGDDLDLIIGAEGTLGIVTTILWRLDHIPTARSGLRIALASLDHLEEAVRLLVTLEPSAVELLDRTFLDLLVKAGRTREVTSLPEGTEAILLVEFERNETSSARGVAGDAVRALKDLALDTATALTSEDEKRLWALRHAASPILAGLPVDRRSMQVIEDGCVPLPALGAYVSSVREIARRLDLTVVIFGHAGDGNVHVNVLPELARADWPAQIETLYREVNETAIRLGGTISGEHGDGRLRAPLLERLYGAEIVGHFKRVKTAFDPLGIFNPGVKLAEDGSPIRQLKIGESAAPIPEDIALALREIERTGGYARSRVEIAKEVSGKR